MELGRNMRSARDTRYKYDFNALGFCDFARMLHNFVATSMIKIFFVVALDCGYFIQLANMCFYSVWIVDYYILCFIFCNSFHGVPCPFSLNYNFSVHNSLRALCFPIAKDAYVITHLLVL
jgi:hypothetical protein